VRSYGASKLWYVTEAGADAVEQLPTRAEIRRKVIAPAQAAGPLRQHTLAVNDAGVAFVHAARARGDECEAFAWRHEVAHPIGALPGRRRGELLIADALLTYLQSDAKGEASVHLRFIELDRATLPVPALAAKLGRYARLHAYIPDPPEGQRRQPGWRGEYPAFPALHVLLAGARRDALERRLEQTIALARRPPRRARVRAGRVVRAARGPCLRRSARADLRRPPRSGRARGLARRHGAHDGRVWGGAVRVAVTVPPCRSVATEASTASARRWTVVHADSLQALIDLPAASIDAVVCDPPYGIDFQGQAWDGRSIRQTAREETGLRLSAGQAFERWAIAWAAECKRVLRPGGHLVAFGAPRTFHRLVTGLEDAGLEIRDVLLWLYGTGMPKSRRLPEGRGTALKPAYEPILLARKKPAGSVERNLAQHGTGALNVDACRLVLPDKDEKWPANVLSSHDPACEAGTCTPDCAVALLDKLSSGRTSRLVYCPKASRAEREAGCEELPRRRLDLFPNSHGDGKTPPPAANAHPTVKPLTLMRWLVRLITPAGGLVLDPFCGSGSTGCAAVLEKRRFLGIEREPDYVTIAQARITHWAGHRDTTPNAIQDEAGTVPAGRHAEASARAGVDEKAFESGPLVQERAVAVGHAPLEVKGAAAQPPLVRLDADAIDAIAQRVAELLTVPTEPPPEPAGHQQLLSAAEVAVWWGVERAWVYQHAAELGALRLGRGSRPRLRFDPSLVARHLGRTAHPAPAEHQPFDRRRSRRMLAGSAQLLPIRGQPELTSPKRSTDRPGGAPTPPATAPKKGPPAR